MSTENAMFSLHLGCILKFSLMTTWAKLEAPVLAEMCNTLSPSLFRALRSTPPLMKALAAAVPSKEERRRGGSQVKG